jgi:hypothetical protein
MELRELSDKAQTLFVGDDISIVTRYELLAAGF